MLHRGSARKYGSKHKKPKGYSEFAIPPFQRQSFKPPTAKAVVKSRKKGSLYGGKNRRASWA